MKDVCLHSSYTKMCDYSALNLLSLDGVSVFPNHTGLDVSSNMLVYLPALFSIHYADLRWIDLSNNALHFVQPAIWEYLEHLEFLNLSNNRIEGLSIDYFNGYKSFLWKVLIIESTSILKKAFIRSNI